jgi:hypothetical protein
MRTPSACFLALVFLNPTTTPIRADDPLVHIQTDRPSYRLGETIWYRVHTKSDAAISLRLLGARGERIEESTLEKKKKRPRAGRFFLSRDLRGGTYRLQARDGARLVHEVAIDVYDLELPSLELAIAILGEVHYPGEEIVATFRARDLDGRPLKNAAIHHLATFGDVRLRDSIASTDDDGRAMLRIKIPENARESGHLALGVNVGGKYAAVARPIILSASVARIDSYPEGGTIVEGHPQRLGLLVRDLDGAPTAAEGRVLDDQDKTVASFHADARGVAAAVVPYVAGRHYRAVIDRPADVERSFDLPGPTGHPVSIFVEPMNDQFLIEVRGTRELEHEEVDVYLTTSTSSTRKFRMQLLSRKPLRRGTKEPKGLPVAQMRLSAPLHAGIGQIHVIRKDRAIVKRAVYLGEPSPVRVTLTPKHLKKPLLVGQPAEFEVLTKRNGKPISTDIAISIFQGDASAFPDMPLRFELEPAFAPGIFLPPDFLEDPEKVDDVDIDARHPVEFSETGYVKRDAFLLVYGAFAYHVEGATLNDTGLPEPEDGRVDVTAMAPRVGTVRAAVLGIENAGGDDTENDADPKKRGKTIVEATGFERLLERAHFTRSVRSAIASRGVELLASAKKILATPGLGRRSEKRPQDRRVPASKVDTRLGLFWSESVRTDFEGRATIKMRLNDVVSDLTWVAQGRSSVGYASGRGSLRPDVGFQAHIETPSHLHVGDLVDLMLTTKVTDGSTRPVDVRIEAPPCLKPQMRTKLRYDPRVDTHLHRFRYKVVAPADDVAIRIIADRGKYREVQVRPLRILHREIEKAHGVAGTTKATESFALKVPNDAIPGTVQVYGSLTPGYIARAREAFKANLQEPHGCFDQYTSLNFANLLTLDSLLELDTSPELIETAYRFARMGYDKILSYRDPKSGGFRLFPNKPATVRCTIICLRHLALYAKLYDGLGRPQLENSLYWLEQQENISAIEALHLTASLNDIGRSWQGARRACFDPHANLYEQALQAYCLATWPKEATERETEQETTARELLLRDHISELLNVLASGKATPDDYGSGLMGGRGHGMEVAVKSLVALALDAVDREEDGRVLLGQAAAAIGRYGWNCGGSYALTAYARLVPPLGERMVTAEFSANPGGSKIFSSLPGSTRAIDFRRSVDAVPGDSLRVSITVDAEIDQEFGLGCRYRVLMPKQSRNAPFRIQTQITPVVDVGQTALVYVTIRPVGRSSASQVVARIGLPGGCEILPSALRSLRREISKSGHVEAKDGFIDFYFENAPHALKRYGFKVRAKVAGNFRARPSLIYPYYETGKESYAKALALKVINTFGNEVDPDELRGAQLRLRR